MATAESQIPVYGKGQTTCIQHKGKQLDFYCEKCKEPVCPKCLSSIHKSHPVCELSEITPEKKHDIRNFIERTEQNGLVQIRKKISSTDTLLKNNTNTFEKLSRELKMQTDKLKQDLDKLTEETLSIYQKMKDDNTKLLQKYKQDLEMYDKQLKQQIQECKTVLQRGSHIQVYNESCQIHSPTSLPVKPVLCTASFTPNKSPQGLLEKALGKATTESEGKTEPEKNEPLITLDDHEQSSTQQRKLEVKTKKVVTKKTLLSETKVVGNHRINHGITSVYPTTDDQAWVSTGEKLILQDKFGKVVQEIVHKVKIIDISLSPKTHRLWICDEENNIIKLETERLTRRVLAQLTSRLRSKEEPESEVVSGQLTQRFRTNEKPTCLCVTASNHVIIGMAKHISKFTTKGQMVLTTMAAGILKPIVCTPYRITECRVTQNVAVIDSMIVGDGHRVVVMNSDFMELFVCRSDIPIWHIQKGDRLVQCRFTTENTSIYPRSVVYDSEGNLIVRDNYRVLLFSGDGEFLKIIDNDRYNTLAIGVDSEDILWAVFSQCYGNRLKLLQYSKCDS